MFDRLLKHHIGIIVDKHKLDELEDHYNKKFTLDEVQETRVMFIDDSELMMYREFIVKEGRVKNMQLGFAHFCYNIKSSKELSQFEQWIKENKIGYPITKLERSGSEECNLVRFFFIKNQGVIEVNLV